MNHKDVLDWKIASLTNCSDDNTDSSTDDYADTKLPLEIESYLAQHPELAQELAFIEQFWHNKTPELEQPSAQLDANFYQMLSIAQAVQHTPEDIAKKTVSPAQQTKVSFIEQIQSWLSPKPLVQFAALGFVFVLGLNLSTLQTSTNQDFAFQGLKQEVSSLSTMLAVSMLQKGSASERLTGVAYSKQSDLTDPVLLQQLISLLENDKSTAVRLAIINALSTSSLPTTSESRLLTLAETEPNVMVQIELYRLLLAKVSSNTRTLLIEKINQQQINPEVRDFLQAQLSSTFI